MMGILLCCLNAETLGVDVGKSARGVEQVEKKPGVDYGIGPTVNASIVQ